MHKLVTSLLAVSVAVSVAVAGWEMRLPVGAEEEDEVGPGGCCTDGRGYVFVAIGDVDDVVWAYEVESGDWIDLELMPRPIWEAGALAYEAYWDGKLFAATDDSNELCVYSFYYPTGWEGSWSEYPIPLPTPEDKWIGPGVALAFQPVQPPPASLLSGYLYLLFGSETRKLYRRPFQQPNLTPDGLVPGDSSEVGQESLVFDWLPMRGAAEYQLQVGTTPGFRLPVLDEITSRSELVPAPGRLGCGTYYWRVRVQRTGRWSTWSRPRRFVLVEGAGRRERNIFPPDRRMLATELPVFDWPCEKDAARYRLQVDDSPSFASPVVDVETDVSDYTVATPIGSGTFYWRTCWMDREGSWSE